MILKLMNNFNVNISNPASERRKTCTDFWGYIKNTLQLQYTAPNFSLKI